MPCSRIVEPSHPRRNLSSPGFDLVAFVARGRTSFCRATRHVRRPSCCTVVRAFGGFGCVQPPPQRSPAPPWGTLDVVLWTLVSRRKQGYFWSFFLHHDRRWILHKLIVMTWWPSWHYGQNYLLYVSSYISTCLCMMDWNKTCACNPTFNSMVCTFSLNFGPNWKWE